MLRAAYEYCMHIFEKSGQDIERIDIRRRAKILNWKFRLSKIFIQGRPRINNHADNKMK